ncbi:MAG: RNA 2',3'-cyclic phosphodiesterase [Solirubrobacteraceae bacterium]|nr:RNA 2',3'-cyclic phosphodiesterase [Solirubrobacteraceae bacterium]
MSGGARLFVAVTLPLGAREEIAGWARGAVGARDDLRLVPADSLHVTLAFLGDRGPAEREAAVAVVDTAEVRSVPIALGAPLWLAPRRPHVLTLGLEDPAGALAALQRNLVAELTARVGFAPERRAFLPHVTVARVRRGARVRAESLEGPEPLRFSAEALVLFRSHLGPTGAGYEALTEVELGSPG